MNFYWWVRIIFCTLKCQLVQWQLWIIVLHEISLKTLYPHWSHSKLQHDTSTCLFSYLDYSHSEVIIALSSWVSQLFAHCVSISATETIITHSAPLSIAVHLHQTLTDIASPIESYHTIVWVAPNTSSDCKHLKWTSNNKDKQNK